MKRTSADVFVGLKYIDRVIMTKDPDADVAIDVVFGDESCGFIFTGEECVQIGQALVMIGNHALEEDADD